MDFLTFDTPLGPMALAGEGDALTHLYLPGSPTPRLFSRARYFRLSSRMRPPAPVEP